MTPNPLCPSTTMPQVPKTELFHVFHSSTPGELLDDNSQAEPSANPCQLSYIDPLNGGLAVCLEAPTIEQAQSTTAMLHSIHQPEEDLTQWTEVEEPPITSTRTLLTQSYKLHPLCKLAIVFYGARVVQSRRALIQLASKPMPPNHPQPR
jgi:hypothetical protein